MSKKLNEILGNCLLDMSQNDNANALDTISQHTEKILRAYANVFFRKKEDIEDVVHDTYLRLYEKRKYYKENAYPCAWITKICKNIAINRLNEKKRYVSYEEAAEERALTYSEEDRKYAENNTLINEMFGQLNDYEKELFIYYFWWNNSIAEMAKRLRKPKSTVESQLYKAISKIKKFYRVI